MITKIKQLFKRRKEARRVKAVLRTDENVRITNETVAARRDEVLGSARKYIYPLQASKHRIVKFSIAIGVAAVVGFFVFCTLELYRFQSTSDFIYAVTRVLPFPLAVIHDKYIIKDVVLYNDYLFQVRHYIHYYQTQQPDSSAANAQQRLAAFKQRSLNQVFQDAYVRLLAGAQLVSVSERDVDEAVALVRSQNRLGASDQVFRNVLNEFWGWSVDDFRRELRQELLAQKVVDKLDTKTHDRAEQALARLRHGMDFATLAKQASDDISTRGNGGDYGMAIGRSATNVAPQIVEQLFRLKQGQSSGIINTGYGLEIVKVTKVQGNTVHAQHIAFNFRPVTDYTKPLQARYKQLDLVHL